MTTRQMQSAFELELARHDSELMIDSNTIIYWLNQGIQRLSKTRYSGSKDGNGFEQSQKRIDDLRTLISEIKLYVLPGVDGVNKPNSSVATLPDDYWFAINEEVIAQFPDITGNFSTTKRIGVTESTHDTYTRQVEDPYSEHILHYEQAKPLRLFKDNTVEIITDGNYQINLYYLRYIKSPVIIDLNGNNCDLPEHMHQEVVMVSTELYLESIGVKGAKELNKIE